MQVSEQKDHITHAVIGGGQTIDFGISSSAEFFNILSTTLYKDQKLAVVREVLCNAWDAHIEAGCTDKPIEITLTEDKFIIKDFGNGIHRDDMGPIYGTYGNSTKKNDGTQTGGFGLGCKAPFAYTDHFEVVSCHDGIRTIYNLSKSSAQAQGKPGIVPIASFPTDQTGLTVSIPVLTDGDRWAFNKLIKRIARNGELKVILNGIAMESLGFDTNQASVFITLKQDIIDPQPRIMVRYGNVIYPVDMVDSIKLAYAGIVDHLQKLSNHQNYYIVFQAPPHSIAVTPSRESLSMQEHTTKTLKGLFEDFLKMVKEDFPPYCDQYAVDAVLDAVKEKRISDLISGEATLPKRKNYVHRITPMQITDLETMAKLFMIRNYPSGIEFRKRDFKFRLIEMSKAKLLDQGLVQTFLLALENVTTEPDNYYHSHNNWLQKHVVARVLGKLAKLDLPTDRLYVFDSSDPKAPRHDYRKNYMPTVVARNAAPKHLFNALPYLRNIVVLASSVANLYERCKKHEVFQKMGEANGFLFYHVGPKKAEKEKALALFNASNMLVVDLTERQPWEIVKTPAGDVTPRKKPKTGIVCMSAVKHGPNYINLCNIQEDDAQRIDNPEFVVDVSLANDISKSQFHYHWQEASSRIIVDLFGDKGGVTNNSATYTKYINAGAKSMDEYVQEKVFEYLKASPTIHEYWAFKYERVNEVNLTGNSTLLELIYRTPMFMQQHGLINNLTEKDKKYLHLWQAIINKARHYTQPKPVQEMIDFLNKIPLDTANHVLLAKFSGNRLLDLISSHGLSSLIRSGSPTDPNVQSAISILNTILK